MVGKQQRSPTCHVPDAVHLHRESHFTWLTARRYPVQRQNHDLPGNSRF